MQMALLQDAESKQKNIKKTPIDFPDEIRGHIKAKELFQNGRPFDVRQDEEEEMSGMSG